MGTAAPVGSQRDESLASSSFPFSPDRAAQGTVLPTVEWSSPQLTQVIWSCLLVVLEPVRLTVSAITITTHTVQTGWGQLVDSTSPEAG